jgi:hypothetical protein
MVGEAERAPGPLGGYLGNGEGSGLGSKGQPLRAGDEHGPALFRLAVYALSQARSLGSVVALSRMMFLLEFIFCIYGLSIC